MDALALAGVNRPRKAWLQWTAARRELQRRRQRQRVKDDGVADEVGPVFDPVASSSLPGTIRGRAEVARVVREADGVADGVRGRRQRQGAKADGVADGVEADQRESERRCQRAVGEARDSIENYTPGESKYSDWHCQICGYSLPPLTYDPGCAARAHMRSHGQPGLDILRKSTAANDVEFKARLERNAARSLEKRLAARRDSFKAQVKGLNTLLPAWSCEQG